MFGEEGVVVLETYTSVGSARCRGTADYTPIYIYVAYLYVLARTDRIKIFHGFICCGMRKTDK